MTVTVRFAPSPTGLLHVGNLRTALFNWCFAKSRGGRFILRLDDTDRERSTDAFAEAIVEDLAWLGIVPDATHRQSERSALYDAARDRLMAEGRLYDAYETPDELDRRRKRQLAMHRPPVYDRAALDLSEDEKAALKADGRSPHWRFKLDHTMERWDDLVRGEQSVDCASMSDPVLIRHDGSYLYTLPSVVDDAEMGVTHVIRGEDHVANTAVQRQLFALLSGEAPAFGHHNLLTLADGSGLSKRLGSLSLRALREAGVEPAAVASYAALVGTAEDIALVPSLDELAGRLDLAKTSRAPAKFEEAELQRLSVAAVHALAYNDVQARLAACDADEGEAFWELVRENLERVEEAADWAQIVRADGPLVSLEAFGDDADFVQRAWNALDGLEWSDDVWRDWTGALKASTGRKGRALFMPLRKALTGRTDGPDLGRLIQLAGPTRIAARRPAP